MNTQLRHVSFIAAQAVAAAETYFRAGAATKESQGELGRQTDRLMCELMMLPTDAAESISSATKLLLVAMSKMSIATGSREKSWRAIVVAFLRLVREEAKAIGAPAQAAEPKNEWDVVLSIADLEAELAQLSAANAAATSWGAAVGARSERIREIESELRRRSAVKS